MTGVRDEPAIGIIGAGRLGLVLAQRASLAGFPALVAGSGDPARLVLPRRVTLNGGTATTAADAAKRADIVILALPIRNFRTIPVDAVAGKLVIDAMNYWWEADGLLAEFTDPLTSSSQVVQDHFAASRIVKTLNHMGYADLEEEARPPGAADRKAIAVAGDGVGDVEVVAGLVDDLGFDPVIAGRLADGVRFEPGTEPFGADVDVGELRAMLDRFPDSQRGRRRAAALAARESAGPDA